MSSPRQLLIVSTVKIAPETAFLSFPTSLLSFVYRKSFVEVDRLGSYTSVAIVYTVASVPAINEMDSIKLPFPVFHLSRVVWDQAQESIQYQIQANQCKL